MTRGRIVVGVDGSEGSKAALKWAIEEARLRDAKVLAAHAWVAYPQLAPESPLLAEDWSTLRDSANEFVDTFVADTIGEQPDVEVTAMAVHGTAASALVEAAKDADLLVVGSRGLGGFTGLLLGSVSQQCAHHSPCPVVIVRAIPVEREGAPEPEAGAAVGS
jgi:nucleotide-binding universal stress UspA family protein